MRLIGSLLIYSLSFWLVSVSLGMALVCSWFDFGAHLAPLGLPLRPLGVPWGSLGGPLGIPWGFLGGPLGFPWVPWGPLGVPWGAQGDSIGVVKNWTSNSEQMCLKYCACA